MTNKSLDELRHAGVKGMKWGVRKERPVVASKTLSNGLVLSVHEDPHSSITNFLSKYSTRVRTFRDKTENFTLKNSSGRTIGEASLEHRSPEELNLTWLGVRSSERGKGYATAVMSGVADYAKSKGATKLTLEVPGDAPDAKHIYEKVGFRVDKVQPPIDEDDVWGGLTHMTMRLNSKTLAHKSSELLEYIEEAIENMLNNNLAHVGVKGMKWGKRKSDSNASEKKTDYSVSTKGKVKYLSEDELNTRIKRLQLETQYKELVKKSYPPAEKFVREKSRKPIEKFGDKLGDKLGSAAADFSTKQASNLFKKLINL